MKISQLFQKPIERSIETVIKAEDHDNILDEVLEYVVTKEISKKIKDLFDEYNTYRNANGVWISGFFGSGKSHLLKMLSHVLQNREIEGYRLCELFAEKIEDDEILKAAIQKAARIPSESILFNIDQQAQITSRADADALLKVFYKVFHDHQGFHGTVRHLAEFESWLQNEGIYGRFKEEFDRLSEKPWVDARRTYFSPNVKDIAAGVLSKILGKSAADYRDIIDTLKKDGAQSIDDFCEQVKNYISTKPKGFRLNFFVDEVGQFISENTKLMLNLQTIAETLAIKTKGHSWIFVTSQEDIEKVVGDMNKSQQNDFSRIQARFALKIALSSANVDEVIERRLLAKNDDGKQLLQGKWKQDHAKLETLLAFSDVGVQFKGYRGEEDFVRKYPFVPYQFDLFQQCIRALSSNDIFQGRHSSVGERSMLGVFQAVAKRLGAHEDHALVSYDLLFEGLRSAIKGESQASISQAEKQEDDHPFAVRVLKALFLVKYYSNFKTTARNVSVLMLDDIHADLKAHDRMVQEALNHLELRTYVQRNGDLYEFLTSAEKDIEKEIKNVDLSPSDTTTLIGNLLYDEILGETKLRYADNKQDYDFTQKIDGAVRGREKELTIEIITPNSDLYEQRDILKAQTMGHQTLLMLVLPQDSRLLLDAKMYLKTERYSKQSQSTSNKDAVKAILIAKQQQNVARRKSLIELLKGLLAEADVYLNGSKHEMGRTSDGKARVIAAFQDLVKLAYPNLRMIGSTLASEDDVRQVMRTRIDDLFGGDDSTITEAENAVLNLIAQRKAMSDRTTLQDLKDHFQKRPFGWYPNAIWKVVAKLYKRAKVELRQDSNLLGDEEILTALLNSRHHSNTLLTAQMEFDARAVRHLIEVYAEVFDEPCPFRDAKDVATGFQKKLAVLHADVQQLISSKESYPFLTALVPAADLLKRLSQKEYSHMITGLKEFEDELLDHKEKLLDPIRKFMSGEQKQIFDSIRSFIVGDASNLEYVEGDELKTIEAVYKHPSPYAGQVMRDAKVARDSLSEKVKLRIVDERREAMASVNEAITQVKQLYDFKDLNADQQAQALAPIEEELQKLKEQRFIANIRQTTDRVKSAILPRQLSLVHRLKESNLDRTSPYVANDSGSTTSVEIPIRLPEPSAIEYIHSGRIQVDFDKKQLITPEDVEEYIQALKAAYLHEIHNQKRISL